MAVTLSKQPLPVVPAYNDIEFEAISTQSAQPNFNFYITVTVGSNPSVVYRKSNGTSTITFNAVEIIKKYIKNYYPYSIYGWRKCTDAIQDVVINIGEEYGSTPTVYTGTNVTITAWNASLTRRERNTFIISDYEVGSSTNDEWLNKFEDSTSTAISNCKSNQDLTFYFLSTGNYEAEKVEVETFNSSGTSLGTSVIACPVYPVTNPEDRYVCINIGVAGLSNIASSLVTGVYPIITGSVASYRLKFWFNDGTGTRLYSYRNVIITDCDPKLTGNVTIHWLNRNGAVDTRNMYGKHSLITNSNKITYKPNHRAFEGSYSISSSHNVGLNPQTGSKVLSSSFEQKREIQTGWLSDYEMEQMKELITSPLVFIQDGVGDYTRVIVENTQVVSKKGEALQSLSLTLSEGITEWRQNEW